MFKENFSEFGGNNNTDIPSSPEPIISHDERMRQLEERFESKEVEALDLVPQKGESINEGYQTVGQLADVLNSSPETIKAIVVGLLENNYKLEIYRQKNVRQQKGKSTEAYSKELIEVIEKKLGEPIKKGYQTARELGDVLLSSPKTIKIIVGKIISENPTLQSCVQENARKGRGVGADAYSPELVELIKIKLKENMIKTGYQTASQLVKVLQSTLATIKYIVVELISENPTLQSCVQENARNGSGVADAYSPELIELIKLKLEENVVKEGYQTASQLEKVLQANHRTIKTIVKELILENSVLKSFVQEKARSGTNIADAYSSELVMLIKERLGSPLKEGYQTARQLQNVLGCDHYTIKAIVAELISENPTLQSYVQVNAQRSGGVGADAYSPELVELIKVKIIEGKIKDGYQTVNQLKNVLQADSRTIDTAILELISENPTLQSCIQVNARNGSSIVDAYSPEFVELIKIKMIEGKIKDGYQTASQLKKILKSGRATINNVAAELISENPTLQSCVQENARNGSGVADAYSPEFVELIKVKLAEMAPKIVASSRGYSFQYSLEILLKLIDNSNLFVEKQIKIKGMKGNHRPDLIHISEDNKKINIFDIKLQTTTTSIEEDTINYTNYIKEKYPEGGNLVFLCLNGPDFPKETVPGIDNVTVRYYHVLDFIERLTDNSRNKFLLRFILGKENDQLSDVAELTEAEIAKINEIKNQLFILRDQVQGKDDKDTKVTPEELAQSTFALRKKLGGLAKKATKEELMKMDFKELMKF